jgi:glycosyltransferase involved in cell wall biosynthesis
VSTSPAEPRESFGVVVASYRGERWLRAQLESILAQTSPVDEIVVSDDGSDDGTVELAREVLADAEARGIRTVVAHNPGPRGVVGNVANALGLARADLVALADQDDVWRADKVARMRTVFATRPELALVHSDARLVDEAGEPLG